MNTLKATVIVTKRASYTILDEFEVEGVTTTDLVKATAKRLGLASYDQIGHGTGINLYSDNLNACIDWS